MDRTDRWHFSIWILRVRSELKKAGTIGGGQFALELPLEYIVYQDTTPPYYMGEMVTNWEYASHAT